MAAALSAVRPAETRTLEALPKDVLQSIAMMAGLSGRAMASANKALRQNLNVNHAIQFLDVEGFFRWESSEIKNSDLQRIVQQDPDLTDLDLSLCVRITDLSALKNLHSLKGLRLSGCLGLRGDCLASLKDLPLEYLDLGDCTCNRFETPDYIHLVYLSDSLKQLDFGAGEKPTRADIARLRVLLPRTRVNKRSHAR